MSRRIEDRGCTVIVVKRIYEEPEGNYRILVDRLWPRGVSKEQAKLDMWAKEIAPSDGLRRWFSHKTVRWEEFRKRYKAELKHKAEILDEIREVSEKKPVALLYAAKDEQHNHAMVLKEVLESE